MLSLLGIPLSSLLLLALYIQDKNAFLPPLSRPKERRLLEAAHAGDAAAKAELIEHNLRLVAHIAKKFSTSLPQQDEFISIGTIGLIKAADTFLPAKDYRFSTYASKCITNEILMFLRANRRYNAEISLYEPIDADAGDGSITLLDTLPDDFDLEQSVQINLDVARLRRFLLDLDERSRTVLVLRYGLDGNAPHTQNEIAARLDISRSYVSRIEKAALEKLRAAFEGQQTP